MALGGLIWLAEPHFMMADGWAETSRLGGAMSLVKRNVDMPLKAEKYFSGRQLELVAAIARSDSGVETFRDDPLLNQQTTKGLLPLTFFVGNEDVPAIRLAIRLGADPNLRVKGRGTPLSTAAKSQTITALDAMLSEGADPNAIVGDPLIHIAGMSNAYDNVKLLVQRGADINARAASGDTLLVSALFQGDMDLAIVALDLGCDPSLPNKFGITAASLARDLWKKLDSNGQRATPFGQRVGLVMERLRQLGALR